jgi:hypothetical protein
MDFSKRLISLDILRGLTIAGMIIVNDPGSWQYVYPPLRHAPWHGITPTDFVFPFFLFIVGVSVVLAYTKRMKSNVAQGPMIRKILVRTAMIFGMGVYMSVSTEAYGHKVFSGLVGDLDSVWFFRLQQAQHKEGFPLRKVILGRLDPGRPDRFSHGTARDFGADSGGTATDCPGFHGLCLIVSQNPMAHPGHRGWRLAGRLLAGDGLLAGAD